MAKKVSNPENTEIIMQPDNEAENELEILPDLVTVEAAQLDALIAQNLLLKTEVGKLITLFTQFESLISGKNLSTLVFQLPKLINNPEVKTMLDEIAPIVHKYTAKTP